MALTTAESTRPPCGNRLNFPLCAALLFAVLFFGCNSTCFTFTSNPPTGTVGVKVSDSKPTSMLTKVNGAVRVQMATEPVCSSCPESVRIQHVFVTIRSIEVHPSTIADHDSPDWQELVPQLAKQPRQVDLIRGTAVQHAQGVFGESAAIPAGIYRQVRLRFVPNEPTTDDSLPGNNACGGRGLNCMVVADGRIQLLLFDRIAPELRITSDRIERGSLLIPPGTNTDLVIELKPAWSWFSSADEGVRLLPALTGNAKVNQVEFGELGTPADRVVHDSLSR